MSHLNYNHLYYFWMVCKEGSVSKAAQALYLTPQTVTGQIKAFEGRMMGKLLKRNGRNVEPTELGQLVYKYADRMFGLSYELMDIVNYNQPENVLFDVGVADALSKQLVSKILLSAAPEDIGIHLRCFESTHELLLSQLSQHKLDMILSDCPVDSSQSPGLYSKKLGECCMGFFSSVPLEEGIFLQSLSSRKILLPGKRTSMGRKIMHWFEIQGVTPDILGEFDDAALMKAFAKERPKAVFIAPSHYQDEFSDMQKNTPLGAPQMLATLQDLKEEYYVIFAERMIQHPAVKSVCETDFSELFE